MNDLSSPEALYFQKQIEAFNALKKNSSTRSLIEALQSLSVQSSEFGEPGLHTMQTLPSFFLKLYRAIKQGEIDEIPVFDDATLLGSPLQTDGNYMPSHESALYGLGGEYRARDEIMRILDPGIKTPRLSLSQEKLASILQIINIYRAKQPGVGVAQSARVYGTAIPHLLLLQEASTKNIDETWIEERLVFLNTGKELGKRNFTLLPDFGPRYVDTNGFPKPVLSPWKQQVFSR